MNLNNNIFKLKSIYLYYIILCGMYTTFILQVNMNYLITKTADFSYITFCQRTLIEHLFFICITLNLTSITLLNLVLARANIK